MPASDADLEMKFLDCAARGIGPERSRTLADALLRLETVPDVAPLFDLAWNGRRR